MDKRPLTSTIAVANYFIRKARWTGGISPLKLNGLVYFSHGWCLGCNNRPLIDECIQAWSVGPVISTLYYATLGWGYEVIPELLSDFDKRPHSSEKPRVADPRVMDYLDSMWNRYLKYSWEELADIASETGSPWEQVAIEYNYELPRNKEIPDEMLRQYFYDPNPKPIPRRNGVLRRALSFW